MARGKVAKEDDNYDDDVDVVAKVDPLFMLAKSDFRHHCGACQAHQLLYWGLEQAICH